MSGLAVLRYLATNSTPVGVTRIARELDLHASTCFNLLKTLVHEGLVNFDEATKTYTVGLGLVELAKGALEQTAYVRMVQPYLQELANTFQVTGTLWHRTRGDRVVLVDRADNELAVRVHMTIGQRLPMFVGALGRSMAANMQLTPDELRAKFDKLRWDNDLTFEQYLKEVEQAKKQGYAVDQGSYAKGVITVSAAVLDDHRQPLMAISAVGFGGRLTAADVKAIGEFIKDRAERISRAMAGGKLAA